jgi:transcriptional regulator with XRE-family HTH domain
MKTQSYLKILQKGIISNELELENALIIERKLRLMLKENPELKETRTKLRSLIKDYEKLNWSKNSLVSEDKVKESDVAEFIAENERKFVAGRKHIIKLKLSQLGLNQQDLGLILGHSKSYISELINGINPFTLKDLVIIHNLFTIKLENLILTSIPQKESIRIKSSILKINKPNLKLAKEALVLV